MTIRHVGPFWRYYGGKWRAAPRYPAPECGTIIEPFAGAAGYACRYPSLQVVLVDASPVIAGIWRYLIAASPEEILALPDIPDGGTVDDMKAPQEARWLAGFWCNGGTAAPRKRPSAWAREYGPDSVHWLGWSGRVRERIAADVWRIKHWQIIEGDYTDAPDIEGTWFIDPPYQTAAGRHYPHQVADFQALGDWTARRKGQVIACDQRGSDWMDWTSGLHIKATAGKHRDGSSSEVMYHRSTQPTLFGGAYD